MSRNAENMIESVSDERSRPPSVWSVCTGCTLGVSRQAGAETGYRQEYRDRSDNNTLTREVVKVDDFPGPSGVCATEYLTVSSPISKRRIFKEKSVADIVGGFGGGAEMFHRRNSTTNAKPNQLRNPGVFSPCSGNNGQ